MGSLTISRSTTFTPAGGSKGLRPTQLTPRATKVGRVGRRILSGSTVLAMRDVASGLLVLPTKSPKMMAPSLRRSKRQFSTRRCANARTRCWRIISNNPRRRARDSDGIARVVTVKSARRPRRGPLSCGLVEPNLAARAAFFFFMLHHDHPSGGRDIGLKAKNPPSWPRADCG